MTNHWTKIALMRPMNRIVSLRMKAKQENRPLETHEHFHLPTPKTQSYKRGNGLIIIWYFFYFSIENLKFSVWKSMFQRAGRVNRRSTQIG